MSELAASLFVSEELHERKVTLFDGSEHTFWFREFTASEYREVQRLARSDSEEDQDAHRSLLCQFVRVARSLVTFAPEK